MGPPSSGVFVCGARPVWLLAARGCLAPHPLEVHGAVSAFTPFNSTDCPQVCRDLKGILGSRRAMAVARWCNAFCSAAASIDAWRPPRGAPGLVNLREGTLSSGRC